MASPMTILAAANAAKVKAFEKANVSEALIKLPYTTPIELAIQTACSQFSISRDAIPRTTEHMNGHFLCAVLFNMPHSEKEPTLNQWKGDYQSIITRAHEEVAIYQSKWNSFKQLAKVIGQKCPYYDDCVF